MNSFINWKVVKKCVVRQSGLCVVDGQSVFQRLREQTAVASPTAERGLPESDGIESEARNETNGDSLVQAHLRAEEILLEARFRAEGLIRGAEEAAALRGKEIEEQARTEGQKKGYADGYDDGRREGLRSGEEAAARLLNRSGELMRLATKAAQAEFLRADREILGLALAIAERIVKASLAVRPQRLLEIVRALALLPEEKTGMVLHLSVRDAEWVGELPPESLPCPWVKDDSLSAGDCFLDCQEGVYDAGLADQLAKLEQLLREELEHGGVEPLGPESSDVGTDQRAGPG
ncbi:Flagellar assembly protein FliH/Type III secretion system HrpE [Acididesulfobacillus acetoxydans]|uniref:Flagellar assembly protein FliH/Type III secretion system HrpE n=1 Tax=Acididesulfobacillus acetoxydans TaxID=1561005 RepID=A0A8S0XCZ6_9FIRM|nr:FliH/SctL family protein [Acididesulfobacillus acetoxydans]CAA7602966.1 Flagellar assembly protein FliH/Type III secretion system HrpE [Acididesulfobacillus acetoxydans]CEJ05848.1 Flagellar biosynthesis/type III secretory pathway protein [Acididesulfobacillus acetoxydans]